MVKIIQHSPFIFTHDLTGACAFFDSLGFTPRLVQPELGYAYCHGRGVALRLLELEQDQPIGEQMVYFDVDDVDAMYREMKPVLDALPDGRARAPFNQSYGQREFHVKDAENCLLLFGAEIPGDAVRKLMAVSTT